MMSSANPNPPRKTLAQVYSHPRGKPHRVLKHTGKSGLSPITPTTPNTPNRAYLKMRLKTYQKNRFHGFLASELRDEQRSYSYYNQNPLPDLNGLIHALFRIQNWLTEETRPQHLPLLPIYGIHDADSRPSDDGIKDLGFWEARNINVWNALVPCLRLATYVLESYSSLAWYHDLFFERRIPIPEDRAGYIDTETYQRVSNLLYSFGSANNVMDARKLERTKDKLYEYCTHMKFGFFSGYTYAHNGLPRTDAPDVPHGYIDSVNIYPPRDENPVLLIAVEKIYPLLNPNLTDSEKYNTRVSVTNAILHELAHAMGRLAKVAELGMDTEYFEPYYADEVLNELGFSWENAVWGGKLATIVHQDDSANGPGLPVMGLACQDAFNKTTWRDLPPEMEAYTLSYTNPLPPGAVDPWDQQRFFPAKETWCHKFFDDSWWAQNQDVPRATFMPQDIGSIENINKASDYHLTHDLSINERRRWNYTDNGYQQREFRRNQRLANIQQRIQRQDEENTRQGLPQLVSPTRSDTSISEFGDNSAVTTDPNFPEFESLRDAIFQARLPGVTALDTMTFAIPEPTLYQYLLRAGFTITYKSFRRFLKHCNFYGLLFQTDWTYPHIGVVTRIRQGWEYSNITYLVQPQNTNTPAPPNDLIVAINDQWQDDDTQNYLATWVHNGFYDVDTHIIRQIMIMFLGRNIDKPTWRSVENYFAGMGQLWSLGPPGILRLRPEDLQESSSTERSPSSAASSAAFSDSS